jgi:hypothetical protein
LARAFADTVDPDRGLGEPDIRDPGPDTANYPNSPYTLPRGWNYLETSPVNLTAGINGRQAEIYNWNYLLRMGITDRVEFRLFGNGLVAAEAGLGKEATSGFAPLVFDTKIHFWDEHPGHLIPAAGLELYVQTPWGSPAFDQGTLPGATLLFRNTLPWEIEAEWNVGLAGEQTREGGVRFTDTVQWAFTKGVTERLALFVQGYTNQAALPRVGGRTVLGGGMELNLSRRFTIFGAANAGTDQAGPATTYYIGGAGAF